MSWNLKKLTFSAILLGLIACSSNSNNAINLPALISIKEFQKIDLESSHVMLIDVRKEALVAKGHIPGATALDRDELSKHGQDIKGMMAEEDQITKALQEIGLDSIEHVILYDEKGNVDAARVWWLLINNGHHKVSLLDGGLLRWKQLGLQLDTGLRKNEEGNFVANQSKPQYSIDFEGVKTSLENPNCIILDVRSHPEFEGDILKKGAVYKGSIPGSVWIEYLKNLDYGNPEATWTFLKRPNMKTIYDHIGLKPEKKVIVYCHSAVRSSLSTFAISQVLGHDRVYNYDGSWREWSAKTDSLSGL